MVTSTPKNKKDKVSGESAKEEMLTTGSNGLKETYSDSERGAHAELA